MSEWESLRKAFEDARKSLTYKVEGVIIQVTEQITDRLSLLKMKRSELATRIDASPAYVTKMLRGGTNFTVESMVKVAEALDSELRIELVPKTSPSIWASMLTEALPDQPRELFEWNSRAANPQRGQFIYSAADLWSEKATEKREDEVFTITA